MTSLKNRQILVPCIRVAEEGDNTISTARQRIKNKSDSVDHRRPIHGYNFIYNVLYVNIMYGSADSPKFNCSKLMYAELSSRRYTIECHLSYNPSPYEQSVSWRHASHSHLDRLKLGESNAEIRFEETVRMIYRRQLFKLEFVRGILTERLNMTPPKDCLWVDFRFWPKIVIDRNQRVTGVIIHALTSTRQRGRLI